MPKSKSNLDVNLYRFDKNYGFWGSSNINRGVNYPDFGKKVLVFQDAFGNRNTRNERAESGKKESPVLFLGGSHTWGAGVENTETFPALFEQLTGKLSLNFGQCSFGLDQIILVLLRELTRIQPKAVVIELHPWVIHRVLRKCALGFPKPYFILDDEILRLVKVPRASSVPFLRWTISDYSEFEKKYLEFMENVELGEIATNFYSDPLYKIWNQNFYTNLYTIIRKLLVVARDECAKQNVELLVVLGPTKQELMHETKRYEIINPFIPRRRLKAIMQIESVQYLDLFPDFDLLKGALDSGIFIDGHINNLGHKIFADKITQKLSINA